MTLAIDWPHDPGENQNRSPAPGPMTLAIPWPHHPGENAAAWPHEPGDRHVKAGIERLQTTNLVEQEKIMEGMLRGILPGAREFEFQPSAGGKPIHGKVAAGLQGIDRLNQLLDQPIRIKMLETRVGKGSVRYRLLEAPTGP